MSAEDFKPGDIVMLVEGRRAYATNRCVRRYSTGAGFVVLPSKVAHISCGNRPIGAGAVMCREVGSTEVIVALPATKLKLLRRAG